MPSKEGYEVHTMRDLTRLRRAIINQFNENELRTLCFDLGIDYENLNPGGKADKARELVALCQRMDIITKLVEFCAQERPRFDWHTLILQVENDEPPFKGLRFYDVDDAHLFFGREGWIDRLTQRLTLILSARERQRDRFLAIVGASGSGKSSLVRAGLIPALQQGQVVSNSLTVVKEYSHWPIHLITPTTHPLRALAISLTRGVDSTRMTTTLMDDLARDYRTLDITVHKILMSTLAKHLFLIIDQFEELFTLCQDEAERHSFISNLVTAAAAETAGPTFIVIVLRADFYHRCAHYSDLRSMLSQSQEYIGPMNQNDLCRVIEEPIIRNGFQIEDGLAERLLQDVGSELGTLPLLSHALLETWQRREGLQLTHQGYQASGGVRGAIAKTADTVYNRLTRQKQTIAHNIFLRLTAFSEGIEPTRRRVTQEELLSYSDERTLVEEVLLTLADARLITVHEESVEIAHEALIREWPALCQWLDENEEGLRLHRRLAEAARFWLELEQDSGALYRGARLALVQAWAADHSDQLNELEREFLKESEEAVAMEERAKQTARIMRAVLLGMVSGAVGFSLVYLVTFASQINPFTLLLYLTAQRMLPGTLTGLLFVLFISLTLSTDPGLHHPRRWLTGGLIGAAVFTLSVLFHAYLRFRSPMDNPAILLLAAIEGASWGFATGLGAVWVISSKRPWWQASPIVAVGCGLVLLLTDVFFGHAFGDAPFWSLFVAGSVMSLFMLFAARLAGMREVD